MLKKSKKSAAEKAPTEKKRTKKEILAMLAAGRAKMAKNKKK